MNNAQGQRVRVGAQAITWGEAIRDDMPRILEALAGLGYEGAEIGARHFEQNRPAYYRDLFAAHGMTPLAVHTGGTFWNQAQAEAEWANIENAIVFGRDAGFRYFALSGNRGETPDSMQRAAAAYERIGAQCREAGLQLVYHTHDWEFANNLATLNVLLDHTTEDNVKLLPDVAWIHRAGVDPAAFLEEHASRIGYVHLKDCRNGRFCELGRGEVPLAAVLDVLPRLDCGWAVVEQDTTDTTPEASLASSADYLKQQGLL